MEPIARVSEADGKASEPATRTRIQLGGPLSKLEEPPNLRVLTSVEKALIDIERRESFLGEGKKWPNLSKLSLKQSKLIELCVEVDTN